MRKIKFRATRVDNGERVHGYYFYNIKVDKHMIFAISGTYRVIPGTVSQYTGLKDKDGVRIYVGDILQDEENFRWEVCEVDGGWVIELVGIPGLRCLTMTDTKFYQVIGNVFENPGLLEV